MARAVFCRCRECERLLLYGQVCVCGHDTNGQERPVCEACGGQMHNPTWGCVRPKVREVQELRRSNASQPHKNKARYNRRAKHRNERYDHS